MRARGGFEFDVKWDKGKLIGLTVKSTVGGVCKLKYADFNIVLNTKAGSVYRLDGELKLL